MRSRQPGDQRIPKRNPHEQGLDLCSACVSSDMHPPEMVPCLYRTHLASDKAGIAAADCSTVSDLKHCVIKSNSLVHCGE